MPTEPKTQLLVIERVERALVVLAYFIELDGDVHVPMYEKFEAELRDLKKKEDTYPGGDAFELRLWAYKTRRPPGRFCPAIPNCPFLSLRSTSTAVGWDD